jgi:DNA-binding GntR family transcriptional regulator
MAADEETIEALGLERGAHVVQLRRVRTADKRPAIYSVDYLPDSLVDLERDRPAFEGSVYRMLSDLGRPVDHGEAIITPATADRDLARLLSVAPGSQLHYLKQVDYDAAGLPVMLSHEWHVPSVIELRVYRRGPGVIPDA